MTLQEFQEDITSWYDLVDFCSDNYLTEYVEDLVSHDDIDSYIDDDISEAVRCMNWREIREYLEDINTSYPYFRRNGMLDYDGLGDYDFDRLKESIIEDVDDDFWDEVEDEEAIEEEAPEFDIDEVDTTGFVQDVNAEFAELTAALMAVKIETEKMAQEAEELANKMKEEVESAFVQFVTDAMFL